MSALPSPNPTAPKESKSAQKKKAKAEALAKAQAQPQTPIADAELTAEANRADSPTNGAEGSTESPYLKELYKNIRNIKKKLNSTAKADAVLAANPNTSLDELLASRKLNADQKLSLEKKPGLQDNLSKLEEQLAQYKKIDEDHQKRLTSERSSLETAHKEEIDKVKAAALAEGESKSVGQVKSNLLVLTRVLRAAAAKRQSGDDSSPESRAFEGILLLVYGGEVEAVEHMEKLFAKSEELVPTIEGTPSEHTYAQVHDLANEYSPFPQEDEIPPSDDTVQPDEAPVPEDPSPGSNEIPVGTDPTIAHAGMTELDTSAAPYVNGIANHDNDTRANDTFSAPAPSAIDAGGAANAAGEANWEAKMSDSWVEVQPRDPAETDTGLSATPAGMTGTQSWAEDVPIETPIAAAASTGDGFHEVHHGRDGRSRGRGGFQGEGRGRGGRPFRGDRGGEAGGYRGRGGGYRGHRDGGEGGGFRGRGGRGRGSGGRGRGDSFQSGPPAGYQSGPPAGFQDDSQGGSGGQW